ncbi:unnamed protein product, partial [marine sediment metagenome]
MRLFRRWRKPAEPPASPALEVAGSICGAAQGFVRSFSEERDLSWASSEAWQLFAERVCLLVNLTDREAFSRLREQERSSFMDELMPAIAVAAVAYWENSISSEPYSLPSPEEF